MAGFHKRPPRLSRGVRVLALRYPVNEMKRKVALGKVIASRVLVNRDTRRRVTVSIGSPTHIGDGWDWVCPYKISGLGHTIHDHVHGIDALQALQLVSVALGRPLKTSGVHSPGSAIRFGSLAFRVGSAAWVNPSWCAVSRLWSRRRLPAGWPRRGDG